MAFSIFTWAKPSLAFAHLVGRSKGQGFPRPTSVASCDALKWAKPSLAFAHLVGRSKGQGFPRPTRVASCDAFTWAKLVEPQAGHDGQRPPLQGRASSLLRDCLPVPLKPEV